MTTYIVKPGESIGAAIAAANAGDIVQLEPGNHGSVRVTGRDFSEDAPLSILANGDGVIIKGAAIVNSSGVVLGGFDVTGTPPNARGSLYVGQSQHVLIRDCRVHDVPDEKIAHAGVRIYGAAHTTVIGCEIDGAARGVEIQRSDDTWVEGCHAHDIMSVPGDSDGFVAYDDSTNTVFLNCVGDHCNDDGVDCWTSVNTTIIGCIMNDMPSADDGNPFKLGSGEAGSGDHFVYGCVGTRGAGCGFNTNGGPKGSLIVNCEAYDNYYGFAEYSGVNPGSRAYGCKATGNNTNWKWSSPTGIRDDSYIVTVSDLPAWVADAPARVRDLILETIGGPDPDPDPDPDTYYLSQSQALEVIANLANQMVAGTEPVALVLW